MSKLKQSKATRSGQAGYELANCLIEIAHLMYQRRTGARFLRTLISRLLEELERREEETK